MPVNDLWRELHCGHDYYHHDSDHNHPNHHDDLHSQYGINDDYQHCFDFKHEHGEHHVNLINEHDDNDIHDDNHSVPTAV